MRISFTLLVVFGFALACEASDRISSSEYRTRRSALQATGTDSVTILFGGTESEHGDIRTGFFQESNFYYLTGWNEPGAILVLTPSKQVLLIPKRNPEQEKWTGRKATASDPEIRKVSGFDTVLDTESFELHLPNWIAEAGKVETLAGEESGGVLKRLLPAREIGDAALRIARLRMTKSAAEVAAVQHSTDVTLDSHRAAWKAIRPGKTEFQVAATMSAVYFEQGCERHAYSPIVGSGPNGAVLHYSKNTRTMDRGELILMDVAAECSMYASDITRTVPVNGKFTPRQRELYEIVLGAQKAAIAAIKPGVMMGSTRNKVGVQQAAFDYINSHGKDRSGNSLGKYFNHGIGHHVGLDVHDPVDSSMPLAAGMIVTVEPGIYIPEEAIGIRVEDVVLVTENGAKLLSSALPREADEIEHAMAR